MFVRPFFRGNPIFLVSFDFHYTEAPAGKQKLALEGTVMIKGGADPIKNSRKPLHKKYERTKYRLQRDRNYKSDNPPHKRDYPISRKDHQPA